MVNDSKVLLDYLLAQASLTALTSTRVWAESDTPPAGYDPGVGTGLAFKRRGGIELDDTSAILGSSFQFKCYGLTEAAADTLYRALYDVLHEAKNSSIKFAQIEALGQTLREPRTEWIYVLCFYGVLVANP